MTDLTWVAEQTAELGRWSNMVTRKLKNSASRFTKGKSGAVIRGKGKAWQHAEDKLVRSLSRKLYMVSGLAEGVGFKLERHGIFVHKGVGRGYIAQGGVVIRGHKTSVKKSKTSSSGISRHPVDWFNPVIEAEVPELANRIASINADAVINELHANIK